MALPISMGMLVASILISENIRVCLFRTIKYKDNSQFANRDLMDQSGPIGATREAIVATTGMNAKRWYGVIATTYANVKRWEAIVVTTETNGKRIKGRVIQTFDLEKTELISALVGINGKHL